MINDMASLKKAMEQMDAEDAAVAEAAKDRAAQILSDAKLNFSKIAELIEQRRLLLRPRIVTSIKRMDQPDALGDAAFRDTGASLRREGQSFRQIAEALELNSTSGPRYDDAAPRPGAPYQQASNADRRIWPGVSAFATGAIAYPLRHPIRFLTIALLAVLLFNALRDFTGFGRRISGYVSNVSVARENTDAAISSVGSFFDRWIWWRSREPASPSPTTPPPTTTTPPPTGNPPSPPAAETGPAGTPARPATGAESSAGKSAASPPPAAPAPRPDARGASPSAPATKDRRQGAQPRALEDVVPAEIRRDSRGAGPCTGGSGGCYWGGGRY